MPKAPKEPKAPKAPKPAKEPKEKKEKKVKDPDAPKKPCGAYMFFCKDMRNEVKEQNPDFSTTDIGRRLGELWKEVSEGDRKKYYDMAEKDKARYQAEDAQYKKTH